MSVDRYFTLVTKCSTRCRGKIRQVSNTYEDRLCETCYNKNQIEEPAGRNLHILKPQNIRTCLAKQDQADSYIWVTVKL